MLNEFCAAWNELYKDHPSEYLTGSVTITEAEVLVTDDERLQFASDKKSIWYY